MKTGKLWRVTSMGTQNNGQPLRTFVITRLPADAVAVAQMHWDEEIRFVGNKDVASVENFGEVLLPDETEPA